MLIFLRGLFYYFKIEARLRLTRQVARFIPALQSTPIAPLDAFAHDPPD